MTTSMNVNAYPALPPRAGVPAPGAGRRAGTARFAESMALPSHTLFRIVNAAEEHVSIARR